MNYLIFCNCKKNLNSKSALNLHQKNTKYCLKIQGNLCKGEYVCECGKNFHNKHHLISHQDICQIINTLYVQELRKRTIIIEQENYILKSKLADALCKEQELREDALCKEQELREDALRREKELKEDALRREQELREDYAKLALKAISRPIWESVIEIEQETESLEESPEEPYELVPLELDNGYIIEHREEDGYINVTNLCRAGGKKFSHWNQLDKTKAFIKALSTAAGIPAAVLIQVGTGTKFGTTENTETNGTWVHPQVAINIAQWISPQFDVKVSAWVYEVMMTGKVDITNTKSYRELQQENKNKQLKIQIMTKKYVKKQPRLDIKERNVIYILTTQLMKKEGRYILGKATNLTNRLSTYNKTDEHEIVYYQECGDEDKMSLVESMVFNKIKEYREQANRERFVISNDKDITFFIDAIKECILFIN